MSDSTRTLPVPDTAPGPTFWIPVSIVKGFLAGDIPDADLSQHLKTGAEIAAMEDQMHQYRAFANTGLGRNLGQPR